MESIGVYFKELRESKNLSLEDISKETKISIHYLKAIEDDSFSDFASIGYARATISSYIRVLKGNEAKVIGAFDEKFHIENQKKHLINFSEQSKATKKYMFSTKTIAFFLLSVLVIILGFITWHFKKSGKLESPFKSIMENERKMEPSQKMKTKIAIKDTLLKKSIAEEMAKNKIKINERSFQDTTDYVNQLLFNGKKSPLNYKNPKLILAGN